MTELIWKRLTDFKSKYHNGACVCNFVSLFYLFILLFIKILIEFIFMQKILNNTSQGVLHLLYPCSETSCLWRSQSIGDWSATY